MIASRGQRRLFNFLGFLITAGLMAYALFAQYVQGYEACPLCIFQRIAMVALGIVFLVAALHSPRGAGARVYAALGVIVALIGATISGRHVYIQHLPEDRIPSCGPGLDYIFDAFPVLDAIKMVFTGSGECAVVNWQFLGFSMPAWVLAWFVALAGLAVYANSTRLYKPGEIRG